MPADPRRLAFLLAVHRAGGILAAAELLGITPSAVSQQISRLEAEEGRAVLDRGPRGVTLTPAGQVLVEAAERIEAELIEAQQAIAALGDGVHGVVNIGAFQTVIRAVVTPALALLAERYPDVTIDIREAEPVESVRKLKTGDLDLVFLERDAEMTNPAPAGSGDVVLIDEPWRLVIPAGMEPPTRLADLAALTFVAPETGTATDRALQRVSRTLGAVIATRHSTYDFDTTLALVAAGQGVALLPSLAIEGDITGDQVQVVRLDGLGERQLFVRHRLTRREPGPAVRAVVKVMTEVAGKLELA
ncbi:MAG: LysR family transcriptional regulator [Promicromonosporaceae bacterium]|nr:LysR family transcriptional regulator [Promicromonosporaceae bacterium]